MRFFTLLLLALCAHAAVVEGVILDHETGNPLSRTQVVLTPLPGTRAEPTTVLTGARGAFVILSVRPGWYVLRATLRGYAPAEDGQSKPGRPGHAFEVADDHASGFHEVRMAHMAAITGTILDENGVGIPRWPVHLYTVRKPMRHVAQSVTDDRGEYRLGELDPGTYLARSGPGPLEDGTTVIATYSKSSPDLKEAYGSSARVGQTTPNVTVRPIKGKLLSVSGLFLAPALPGSATLTLITDTGRREVASGSNNIPFAADKVQPGPIELLVSGHDPLGNVCGSYYATVLETDLSALRVACNPLRSGGIDITGVQPRPPAIVRRVDLDGASQVHVYAGEPLIPGHWELSVPRGNYYVQSARSSGRPMPQSGDWYAFEATAYNYVTVLLSTRSATISGTVFVKARPVTGAPVFVTNAATGQQWTLRTDPNGKYSAIGLGPGAYSLISSFELDDIEDQPRQSVTVTAVLGNTVEQSLELLLP